MKLTLDQLQKLRDEYARGKSVLKFAPESVQAKTQQILDVLDELIEWKGRDGGN